MGDDPNLSAISDSGPTPEDTGSALGQRLDARFVAVDGRFDELHRHLDALAESLREDLRRVAERLFRVGEKVDRVERELSAQIRESVVDFRSALGASHRGLDGRVTVLEAEVSDVRSRVERLEADDRG